MKNIFLNVTSTEHIERLQAIINCDGFENFIDILKSAIEEHLDCEVKDIDINQDNWNAITGWGPCYFDVEYTQDTETLKEQFCVIRTTLHTKSLKP
jgi:Cu2+-containing amine oxidase